MKLNISQRMEGCLLGGAMGDALGYPVEFMNMDSIHRDIGPEGVVKMPVPGLISDDTQMTLFTAEAVLSEEAKTDWIHAVHKAYLRWYYTQTEEKVGPEQDFSSGLLQEPRLFHWRMPGNTCMHMLSLGRVGTMDHRYNMSKGCGGIMRVAPCAVMDDPFLRACEAAAITHDHPTGYLCAGAFAQILACLMRGESLEQGIEQACARLITFAGHEETIQAINAAVELAATNPGDAAMVETLGGGWVGEETLAIALYCALSHPDDFEKALLLSVNHSGDSDSTGAVCGNLMGMKLGVGVWPEKWKKYLELNELIGDMGRKLAALVPDAE